MNALRIFPESDDRQDAVQRRLFDTSNPSSPPPRRQHLVTVQEVIDWFLANGPDGDPKALKERRRILTMFTAGFGSCAVDDLNGNDLVEFVAGQKRVTKGHTIARWYRTLKHPFNLAEELGLILRRPFRRVKLPKGDRGRDLLPEEFRALLRLATPPFRRILIFLLCCGGRPGEVKVAEWVHVKAAEGRIVLPRNLHKTGKKTGKPRRIKLNSVLVKLLKWLKRRAGAESHIFLNSYGRPWKTRALCKNLQEIRAKAQLPKDVKLYGCRHTFATQQLLSGTDLATLAELLGHESVKTTEWYVHLAGKDDHLSAAAEKAVGALFKRPR